MGRQLGWVWFGGREYKIVVFYLTNDNSVFCRENDDDPVLLVSQLPKRVELGLSGTLGQAFLSSEGLLGYDKDFFPLGGYDIFDGFFNVSQEAVQLSIGNSLDDLREVIPEDRGNAFPESLRYRASTVDIFVSPNTNKFSEVRCDLFAFDFLMGFLNGDPNINQSGTRVITVGKKYDNTNSLPFSISNITNLTRLPPDGGEVNYSITSISNAYGFMARVIESKTIFAVTDKIGSAEFVAYRGRITTGTIDNFQTYELPDVPTLDPDLFTQNDSYPADQKVPYSILGSFRFFNRYNANHSTTCFVDGISLSAFEGRDYMTSGSTVAIKIFDSAIHQNNSQAISQQIPGLPANTKAVLGVLACPV
jgi:hypothetical protein